MIILAALIWLGMIAVLIVASWKQRPWRWNFSIQSLLVLTAAVALVCGYIAIVRPH
jgi:hypothetical protein